MKLGWAGFAILLCSSVANAQGGSVACPPELTPAREAMVAAIERHQTPSATVVVTKGGEVIWAEGFGFADIERGRKAHPDSIYLLASVSKPLTATGLMMLVDEGKIDLDRPVNDYLPRAKLRAYLGNPADMTVRRLANHTSGMPTHYSFFYDDIAPPPMDETIRRFGYATYEPGSRWNYSNLAFGILNYVTEVVSGQDWSEYMEKRVYDPIGMTGTSDHVRSERIQDRAQIYTPGLDGRFLPVDHYEFDHPGASAIWSSAHDLARFLNMHLNNGTLDGVRILQEETAKAMRVVRHGDDPNNGTGVGWAVNMRRGHVTFSHSGGMPGVSTQIRAWPEEDVAAVVLTNSDNHPAAGNVMSRIERALIEEGETERRPTRDARDDADEKPMDYTGKWTGRIAHFDGDIPMTITVESKDKIYISFGPGRRRAMNNVGAGRTLRGTTQGIIPVQSTFHGLSNLLFTFEPQNENWLTGTVFATAAGYYGVSFFAELNRELDE